MENNQSLDGYYEYQCCEPECQKTWVFPSWQGKHTLFSGGTNVRCTVCGAGLAFTRRIGKKEVQPKAMTEEMLIQHEILGLLREIRDSLQEIQEDVRETRKRSERPINIVATIDSSKQFE